MQTLTYDFPSISIYIGITTTRTMHRPLHPGPMMDGVVLIQRLPYPPRYGSVTAGATLPRTLHGPPSATVITDGEAALLPRLPSRPPRSATSLARVVVGEANRASPARAVAVVEAKADRASLARVVMAVEVKADRASGVRTMAREDKSPRPTVICSLRSRNRMVVQRVRR